MTDLIDQLRAENETLKRRVEELENAWKDSNFNNVRLRIEIEDHKKVSEGRRVGCLHAKEMIELFADLRKPKIAAYWALINTLEACSKLP